MVKRANSELIARIETHRREIYETIEKSRECLERMSTLIAEINESIEERDSMNK